MTTPVDLSLIVRTLLIEKEARCIYPGKRKNLRTMSDVGAVDSPQDDQRSVKISEDPNSQAALEDLFKVLSQDKPKLGKPMSDRKLPESFFNAKAPRLLLGPSISVRPNAASSAHHLKSFSMPANLEPGHSRPLSLESTLQELPPGWEEARTPDGLTYYIE